MATVLLRGVLLLFLLPAFVHTESHWESYMDWVLTYQWSCYEYYYTYCTDWSYYGFYLGYYGCGCHLQQHATLCFTARGISCYPNCFGWVYVVLWRCQQGWKGSNCDIPICDPACSADQLCIRPYTCDCYRGPTGECKYEPCDDDLLNCYPGYCNKTSYDWKCVCPPGFTGPNCQTITNTPDISRCTVQVFGTPNGQVEQEVAKSNECAASGLDPLPIWIGSAGANSLTTIIVTWQAQSVNVQPLPGGEKTPYILNAPVPIGIVETNFTVSFPNETNVPSRSVYCIGPDPVMTNPPQIKQCNSQSMQWSDLGAGVSGIIKTNTTFTVSIEAQLGGVKTGNRQWAGGRFNTPQNFTRDPNMNTTIRKTKFAFDLEPPFHCLSTKTNCSVFPIFLNQTITPNPVIQPTFNDWYDSGSGISRFHAEVYFMQKNANGRLVETGNALVSADVNVTLNNFRFTCPTPGVYSIILTVYDKANNYAKARKIFNYDDHDSSIAETSSPMYLDKADPQTSYQFITNLEKLQSSSGSYDFSFIWAGHFVSSFKNDSMAAVDPWQIESSGTIIDDNKGTQYGLRSIDALSTTTGVLGYEVAYLVDGNYTGGIGVTPPSNFTAILKSQQDSFPVSVSSSLKDGDTIVVWLNVYDLYGRVKKIRTKTYIDTSRFNTKVGKQEFKKHYPDDYNSSVLINVVNKISGIKNITYEIYDNTRKLPTGTGTVIPDILEPPSAFTGKRRRKRDTVSRPCYSTDATCYCTPQGTCYNVTQVINIDNCLIDRSVTGDEVIIRYTVHSVSGWSFDGSVDAGVLSADDIRCRGGLSTGAIVGICLASIIFFILLILLIILLLLMLIRWRVYRKHPIPARIRTTIHNTFGRNTASAMNIMSENDLYATKGDIPPIKKSNESRVWANKLWDVDTTRSRDCIEDWLVSGKDLQIGDVIDEGRFAVVRKGFLSRGNETTPVAIKALRSGFDKIDPEVMSAKISFLANQVKPHHNIIRFIGAVAEGEGKATSPPSALLLELCDKSLKDWLSEIAKVDTEVLEEMLSFTLQIAHGVRHLHDQKIIHRRLAVRNVLLKRTLSGYEVKLIGFGPSKEDLDAKSNEQSTLGLSVVPLKWMAPETLDTLNSKKPTYDEKTDAWSYGVTCWEIYSKGEPPFSDYKSVEMRSVLKRGERLNCPDHCPPDIFNQVLYPCWNATPKKRPTFSKICTTIEQFRNGMTTTGGYYAPIGTTTDSSPPGYYAARDAFQGDIRRPNNLSSDLYHDARSG